MSQFLKLRAKLCDLKEEWLMQTSSHIGSNPAVNIVTKHLKSVPKIWIILIEIVLHHA